MSEAEVPSPPPPPPAEPPAAPPPAPPPPAQGGASDNRGLMIALSYLWLLALVPLLVEKDDAEVQWHAKHGIVLMVIEVAIWLGLIMFNAIAPGCLVAIINLIIFVAIVVLHIICIVKGVGGERFIIPSVSQYADRF